MYKLYLRPIGDNTQYLNAQFYETDLPYAAPNGMEWIEGDPPDAAVPYRVKSPLDKITEAVKGLPVAKRTDANWGGFINQCLLAIQNGDSEALAYLINGYQTTDADYQNILSQAKTLFGITGGA